MFNLGKTASETRVVVMIAARAVRRVLNQIVMIRNGPNGKRKIGKRRAGSIKRYMRAIGIHMGDIDIYRYLP